MVEKFLDVETYLDLSPSQLANTTLQCPYCGRSHSIPFKVVKAGHDLVNFIPQVVPEITGKETHQIGIVYDRHIEEKLDDLFFRPFNSLGLPSVRIPLGERGHLLEPAVEIGDKAAHDLSDAVDFLIGVGSGVISDLTKWIATKRNLPYILMGTAASMNAYTSITGTMTENNIKTSKWLDPASGVLLDSTLLASAPTEMTCAGICDLLARNVSNADWKLSEIIRRTYFCPVPFMMMKPYQERFSRQSSALGHNEVTAMQDLGEAILVSGYSMTVLDGETSPSSGSEHVISHFFDFQHEVFDRPKNLHGTQVGIGTILMSTAFEILRQVDPKRIDPDDLMQRRLSQTAISRDHRQVFGKYGKVFDKVIAKKRIPDDSYRDYISLILDSWDDMWKSINPYLLPSKTIRQIMADAGAVTNLSGIHRSPDDTIQALLYGANYRSRYTILDLFWELGLFPKLATQILVQSKVIDF